MKTPDAGYGFTPAEDRPWQEPAWSEQLDDVPPADAEEIAAENAPPAEIDYANDPQYIEIRQMLFDTMTESDGLSRPPITRYLLSSRYHSTWRLREPQDGDAPFIKIPAVLPQSALIAPETVKGDPWNLDGGAGLGKRDVHRVDWTKKSAPSDLGHPEGASAFWRWGSSFGR